MSDQAKRITGTFCELQLAPGDARRIRTLRHWRIISLKAVSYLLLTKCSVFKYLIAPKGLMKSRSGEIQHN